MGFWEGLTIGAALIGTPSVIAFYYSNKAIASYQAAAETYKAMLSFQEKAVERGWKVSFSRPLFVKDGQEVGLFEILEPGEEE